MTGEAIGMYRGRGFRTAFRALPVGVLLLALLLVLLGVSACGCGGKEQAEKPATRPAAPDSQPSGKPADGGSTGPIIISGGTSQASQPFRLSKGVALFSFRYSGGADFKAVLLDSTGRQVDVLADVNTSVSGSTAAGVTDGQYVVDVEATGAWEIDVEQDVPAVLPYTPLSFTGNGPEATEFFQSAGKNTAFQMNFTGSSKFTVILLDSKGEVINTVADAPGPYSATVSLPLAAGVSYLIDVEAVGPWTVTVD